MQQEGFAVGFQPGVGTARGLALQHTPELAHADTGRNASKYVVTDTGDRAQKPLFSNILLDTHCVFLLVRQTVSNYNRAERIAAGNWISLYPFQANLLRACPGCACRY